VSEGFDSVLDYMGKSQEERDMERVDRDPEIVELKKKVEFAKKKEAYYNAEEKRLREEQKKIETARKHTMTWYTLEEMRGAASKKAFYWQEQRDELADELDRKTGRKLYEIRKARERRAAAEEEEGNGGNGGGY
jgi:hypothetical protein